jgi:hypothetical protein
MFLEKYRPKKDKVCTSIEPVKIKRLPWISASLGKTNAARVHPTNKIEPIKPTSDFYLHARSNDSYQLCRDVSASHTTLLFKLVPQKYGTFGSFELN